MRSERNSAPGSQLILGVLAAACLTVTACGSPSGATPDQPNGQPTSTLPASTIKFCSGVQTAMAGLAGKDPSNSMSLKAAKATLDGLLTNGIKNFTALEKTAPSNLTSSIATIVADFRSYEALANKAKTVKQLLDSSVRANPVQKTAYQELISYTSDTCS